MPPQDLGAHARTLIAGGDAAAQAEAELAGWPEADRVALAWAIKEECIQAWTAEPPRTQRCAALLAALRQRFPHPEVAAAASWCEGLAQLTRGHMEAAMSHLDDAQARLLTVGQAKLAAQSQITKVMALSMLGRHDDALASGEVTLAALLQAGDELSAGKVELNLGWMLMRRDRYDQAEKNFRQAAVRFARAGDVTHSIMADIGSASARTWQFEFDEAHRLYERAEMRARARDLRPLLGVIDTNRGRLELHRGRFERALRSMEAALRQAEKEGAPHDVAETQRDLADTYLGLNLLPEAVNLYDETIRSCTALDAPVERAWAETQRSLAIAQLGDVQRAAAGLVSARELFAADDNHVGVALADLRSAGLLLDMNDPAAALQRADAAASALRATGVDGWRVEADLHAARALTDVGKTDAAQRRYEQALQDTQDLPELRAACHVGFGNLLLRQGDSKGARLQFECAVHSTELQRAALPGDEFRTAYGADKQRAYDALIELALEERDAGATWRLLRAIEQARSPALRVALARDDGSASGGIDAARREQLHWLHGQWRGAIDEGDLERAQQLQTRSRKLEQDWLEEYRRAQAAAKVAAPTRHASAALAGVADAQALTAQVPEGTALVVYVLVGERLAACVTTRAGLAHVQADASGLVERLEQLRFQVDSLRFGAPALRAHSAQMAGRCRAHLQALHAIVWQPVAPLVGGCERVVIVPHRHLHYLPFCALHDGATSLVERHEISLAASVDLWLGASQRPSRPLRRVAAVGVGGESLPHVAAEVQAVADAFVAQAGGSAAVRLDGEATQPALRAALPGADVLHLACHGQFRADSPYFSALHLADGPLTVRDAADLPLQAELVTLSACESGMSEVAPGDELLGLLRGFLLAGARRVVSTYWTVDDASTAQLMGDFYRDLLGGRSAAAALRAAQRRLAQTHPHPYHWAAFGLHERG